jgi:hypothetical protein
MPEEEVQMSTTTTTLEYDLEEIKTAEENWRQQVNEDIQALTSLLHGQISLYEDWANSFCLKHPDGELF